MLILQDITYTHPNKDVLFTALNFTLNTHDKVALTGNNGVGKSTLLNLLAGNFLPSAGQILVDSQPYYVPQLTDRFNDQTIAEVLGIAEKLRALKAIVAGDATAVNFGLLDDDWMIEERCREAFAHWQLEGLRLDQPMNTLSGGQKTKVFLAGIAIHQPEIVLLDEPSNHLDEQGRNLLYAYIRSGKQALVVVSHDRKLLNLLHTVYELDHRGLTAYGGNYDFYSEQKRIANDALNHELKSKEKALRKAKETEKAAMERRQKLDARGKRKQESAGLPTISMNTLRNNAEKSTSRMKGVHAEKTEALSGELSDLRAALPRWDNMKLDLDHSALHNGKLLIAATGLNVRFGDRLLWKQELTVQIRSGERIAIKGPNGSGKTTGIRLLFGELQPASGTIERALFTTIYVDQDYSLIDLRLSVYEQAQRFNSGVLQEHEIKIRLNRFLFTKADWDKPCGALSGGERMRLMLCCLTIMSQAPDMIILDEPTNNLDLQNVGLLTAAMNDYRGTLLVVSHDVAFVEQMNVERSIVLE